MFGGTEIVLLQDLKSPETTGFKEKKGCYHDCGYYKDSFLSIRTEYGIACLTRKMRFLNIKFYSGNMGRGSIVDELKETSEWYEIDPKLHLLVCKK